MWAGQACVLYYHIITGALVLGGKAGYPAGSLPLLPSPVKWEGVWVSPCVFFPNGEYLFVGKTLSPFVSF